MSWRVLTIATLLTSLLGQPALAQSAATTISPSLGRLFLTPDKRQTLERQRQLNLRENENPESDTLQLNGVVQRSSGHNSVWLNQRMQADDKSGKVRVRTGQPAEATITVDRSKPVQLQVGESVDRNTNERKDVVSPDAVRTGKSSSR